MQEGVLDLKLDGVWVQAKVGDLVRMPVEFRIDGEIVTSCWRLFKASTLVQ